MISFQGTAYVASLSQLPSSFYQPAQNCPKTAQAAQLNHCQFDIITVTNPILLVFYTGIRTLSRQHCKMGYSRAKTNSLLICTELLMIMRFYQITNNRVFAGQQITNKFLGVKLSEIVKNISEIFFRFLGMYVVFYCKILLFRILKIHL